MKRREFLSVVGGATILSTVNAGLALAGTTTPLYLKGLVIVDFGNPEALRIGFPKAPRHKATLGIVAQNGSRRAMTIKGNGSLNATDLLSFDAPRIAVPELVRMEEFYGPSIKSRIVQCPSVLTIPFSAIRSVTTAEVSESRYTFVRADNGEEINSFRPRRIAETIKIDLSSTGVLRLENGKVSIPLESVQELRVDYAPESLANFDAYHDHFQHYFSYVERPAALDFDVVPRKLGQTSSPAPKVGNRFMMIWPDDFCYLVGIH